MANDLYYILAAKKGTDEYKPVLPQHRAPRAGRTAPNIDDILQCTAVEALSNQQYLAKKGYDVRIVERSEITIVPETKVIVADNLRYNDHV
jgi:hypothetical protein